MKKQTLYGVWREFGDAWNDFVLELAYSLGIHHVCSWLTRVIRWCLCYWERPKEELK